MSAWTDAARAKCRDRCAEAGDPPCWELGPEVEAEGPCEDCKSAAFVAAAARRTIGRAEEMDPHKAERDQLHAIVSIVAFAVLLQLIPAIEEAREAEDARLLASLQRIFLGRMDRTNIAVAARYMALPPPPMTLEAEAAKASFAEDHSLDNRSWGKGRHSSIPKTHGAEGRNWAGE